MCGEIEGGRGSKRSHKKCHKVPFFVFFFGGGGIKVCQEGFVALSAQWVRSLGRDVCPSCERGVGEGQIDILIRIFHNMASQREPSYRQSVHSQVIR